ncbi:MAG: type II CAAX endopeptidase family protein [Polyangiaceae bacterium]
MHVWPVLPIYAGIIIGLVFVFDPRVAPLPDGWDDIVSTAVAATAVLVWWFRSVRPRGVPVRDMLGARLDARGWALAVALVLSVVIVKYALIVAIMALYGEPPSLLEPRSPATSVALEGVPLWVTLFCEVILIPITEEIVFRGTLFRKWRLRWGAGKAAIASSVAFGLLHQNVLTSSLSGLVYVTFYARTRTLWACIAIHVLNNGFAQLTRLDGAVERAKSIVVSLSSGPAAVGCALLGVVVTAWLALFIRSGWRTLDARLPPEGSPRPSPSA